MKLCKLSKNNIKNLHNKKICCFGYSVSHIEELCEVYDLAEQIDKIVDENLRNQGMHIINGKNIEVCGLEYLERLDVSNISILIISDYFREAYEKLSAIVKLKTFVDIIYYFADKETEYELAYREQYKDSSLKNLILFRSGPHASSYVKGMDFTDNARALFEYMLQNGYNEIYELVWLVKDPNEFEQYQDIRNVRFLSYDWSVSGNMAERDSYYQVLCLAKYLFFTDAYGFARNCREDQIRIQLWHGCGFKTRVNFVRCEKRYEYTTVISELYSNIHQKIYGLRAEQMLVTGYAKQDYLFHPVVDWQDKFDIPRAQKYIFWLPTFRTAQSQLQNLDEYELCNQTSLPVIGTYEMLAQLDKLLERLGIVMILKLHPFQDKETSVKTDLKNFVILDNEQLFENDIQINQLLGHADALISDYSSVAVDYMVLDRPIAFTLDDVEEYRQSRGFVFENIREWLPGMEVLAFEDMCQFVTEVGSGIDSTKEKRRELTQKMHRYQDDRNCMRIIDALQL